MQYIQDATGGNINDKDLLLQMTIKSKKVHIEEVRTTALNFTLGTIYSTRSFNDHPRA